jgi:hypothetical protein
VRDFTVSHTTLDVSPRAPEAWRLGVSTGVAMCVACHAVSSSLASHFQLFQGRAQFSKEQCPAHLARPHQALARALYSRLAGLEGPYGLAEK